MAKQDANNLWTTKFDKLTHALIKRGHIISKNDLAKKILQLQKDGYSLRQISESIPKYVWHNPIRHATIWNVIEAQKSKQNTFWNDNKPRWKNGQYIKK